MHHSGKLPDLSSSGSNAGQYRQTKIISGKKNRPQGPIPAVGRSGISPGAFS